jgi:thiol:disulfide interchange protein DsbD
MLRRRLFWILLAALATGPLSVSAGDVITSEHLSARLVAENAVTRPGDTVTIALHQKMAPGWHTYWRNPGDSGQAPALVWELPDGVAISDPVWPAPHRIPVGPLVNFGYSDETALLFDVTVPETWAAGTPLALAAEGEILVCAEICIPVTGRLSLEVATGAASRRDGNAGALFAAMRAEQPLPAPWPLRASAEGAGLELLLEGPAADFASVSDAYLFSESWGVIEHAAPQRFNLSESGLSIGARVGEAGAGKAFSGVVTLFQNDAPARSFTISQLPIAAAPVSDAPYTDVSGAAPVGFITLVVLALAGGLLLNLMPCVFPVLAMKALGLARHADLAHSARIAHGVAYTSGVVVSFLALAAVMLALRAGGAALGWGFQLQEPLVIGALAYVCVAVGLNLSGVFEIGARLSGIGGAWAMSEKGHAGSFATGVLAAVVAAPCTAPFMATATGGALLLPAPAALGVFAALGFGLALPYLAVSALPALARRLPKPGPWMVRFKQFLAFPMYATAAWLIWVLSLQAGADAAFLATLGLIAVAFACWALPTPPPVRGPARALSVALVIVSLAGAGGLLGWASHAPKAPQQAAVSGLSESYSDARLVAYRNAGRTVFVNMTAAWCITCKVNERVALSGESFAQLLSRHDVAYLQGDWTNRNPEITRFLERFGRLGVPLYVIFPAAGGDPLVLPQILKPGAVGDALSSLASGTA